MYTYNVVCVQVGDKYAWVHFDNIDPDSKDNLCIILNNFIQDNFGRFGTAYAQNRIEKLDRNVIVSFKATHA